MVTTTNIERIIGIDVERDKINHNIDDKKTESDLEKLPEISDIKNNQQPSHKKSISKSEPEVIVGPIDTIRLLQMENRELYFPELKKEKKDIPIIPDIKKAEEDYNSVDYQIIAMNLWKAKARE